MSEPLQDLEETEFYPEINTVTIASGQTVSSAADLNGTQLVAIETPSALTSTALTFQASDDNSTFLPVVGDTGTTYTVTVSTSAARHIPIDSSKFVAVRFVKVVAGSTEGAARTITLVSRALS